MSGGSVQLRQYLRDRRAGVPMDVAALRAGLTAAEARLTDADEARGLLAHIDTTDPAAGAAAALPEEQAMAKKAKPGDGGDDRRGVTNLTETKEVIRESVAKILSLRSERKEINAAIGEQRARVKNYGVPPAALDLALRMKEADPEDRQLHDEGYAIARDALGLRMQGSLFDTLNTADDTVADDAPEPDGKVVGFTSAMSAARTHLNSNRAPDAVA